MNNCKYDGYGEGQAAESAAIHAVPRLYWILELKMLVGDTLVYQHNLDLRLQASGGKDYKAGWEGDS